MIKQTLLALTTAGMLSFCDNAEQRVEKHYQSGLELLQEGDVDRALVEFRNVFNLDGQHREARLQYADAERARGNLREAYGHYSRLVEQYPDSLPGHRALAELSLLTNNWDAARKHGAAAAELAPDDLLVQAVNTAVSYRDALVDNDAEALRTTVTQAQTLISEDPESMVARRVVISDLMRTQDWSAALAATDAALAQDPYAQELYMIRLGILNQFGETGEIRAQLEEMITRFPDDPNVPATLMRWYISQGDIAAAESFLKQRSDQEPRNVNDIVTYIRFLSEFRSHEIASAELERILAENPPEMDRLSALQSVFRFDLGARDVAISEMEELVERMEPSDERRDVMIMLANMLEATDNKVGARALIEEVLAEDGAHTEALKLRAGWLIESDRVDEAIVALRTALGQSPNDAQVMTLLAQAHERAGNRELMAEMMSRAVEASNNAPEETLRYARYLISQGNLRSAETVLINALRLVSDDVDLLSGLGEIYMREQDWPRLTQIIDTLQRQENAKAERIANELTARQLASQNREEDLMVFLNTLTDNEDQGMNAVSMIVRTRLAQGDVEGARDYVQTIVEENPEDANARFLLASVNAVTGDVETAQEIFSDLTEQNPKNQRFWMALYNVHTMQEDESAARQALLDGLAELPENLQLNWLMAGFLEKQGDIEGAITIYERLYSANTNNVVIANNFASLLATAREDAESLERAHEIARRLRDLEVPAFQDTYGWIAFRRGDLDSALASLEPAALGLPEDATVQYHLARIYDELGRDSDALSQFRKVVEVVADGPRPAFMDEVEAAIDRLSEKSDEGISQN